MDKKKLKIAFKLFMSCFFVGYLCLKVKVSAIAVALKGVDLIFYSLSTLIAVASTFFIAGKYYILIRQSPIKHSLLSLIKINFISRFYALFLPSAVGREFIRWIKITRNQGGRAFFLACILLERLTSIVVLLLCGTIPLLMHGTMPTIDTLKWRLLPWVVLALMLCFLLLTFYVSAAVRSGVQSIVVRLLGRYANNFKVASFFENFSLANIKASFYCAIIGLTLVWLIFYVARLSVLIKATDLPLNTVDIAWMGALVLLLQTLPLSLAGIGLREGAYAYLFMLYKLPPENGVLIGVLFFSQMLIMAAVGGVFELMER
ncbi:MAG: flippase-like domain-containing protein [Desulfobacterales bacterium]|nr:MAG: flippase-like domain-containing protein [Desulfobacterales bacterium]